MPKVAEFKTEALPSGMSLEVWADGTVWCHRDGRGRMTLREWAQNTATGCRETVVARHPDFMVRYDTEWSRWAVSCSRDLDGFGKQGAVIDYTTTEAQAHEFAERWQARWETRQAGGVGQIPDMRGMTGCDSCEAGPDDDCTDECPTRT